MKSTRPNNSKGRNEPAKLSAAESLRELAQIIYVAYQHRRALPSPDGTLGCNVTRQSAHQAE